MRLQMKSLMGMMILAGAGLAGAHLVTGSLTVNGGAAVAAGANVSVAWKVSTSHGSPINIDVSSDGGTTWKSLKAGLSDAVGSATSKVDMPAEATTHAKIRVCQGSASACASIKASQPSTAPYALVSDEFSITGTSAIISDVGPAYALGFEQGTGKFVAAFDLASTENVVLQAVDLQGRVLATLLDQAFPAGAQKMSLELPKELASASTLIFRLKLGETVRTQAFTRH